MSASHASNREIEIKLPVSAAAGARRLLRRHRWRVQRRRALEINIVFDTSQGALRRQGALLRLRRYGDECLITYKGPSEPGKHKSREELQIEVPDFDTSRLILERLGFRPAFHYEKFRSEYRRGRSRGLITLDETPIGAFLELEGSPAWIDRTARLLGYSESQYVTDSYGELFRQYRRRHRLQARHMTFRDLDPSALR